MGAERRKNGKFDHLGRAIKSNQNTQCHDPLRGTIPRLPYSDRNDLTGFAKAALIDW